MSTSNRQSNGLLDFILASSNSGKVILERASIKPIHGDVLILEKGDINELPSKTELHAAVDSE